MWKEYVQLCDNLVKLSICIILQAIWLPGTQTELAIVTADFVKVGNSQRTLALTFGYYLLYK